MGTCGKDHVSFLILGILGNQGLRGSQGCLLQGDDSLKMDLVARGKQWGRGAGQKGQTVEASYSWKNLQNTSVHQTWPYLRLAS